MKLFHTSLALLAAATFANPTIAQDLVDIGLHRNGDRLEVHARPTSNFNGIVSSIVFAIRWDRNTGATLGSIEQEGGPGLYIPMTRSGNVHEEGSSNYQVFAGFGITPLEAIETSWVADKEVVIASFAVTGKGEFELVNDAWTHEPAHNADYYISLGGQDRTGIIYKGLATAEEVGGVSIQPNPNNGRFTVGFSCAEPTDVTVEIMNSLGQAVFNETLRAFEGTYRKEVDLTTMSNGAYYLKVKRNGETSTHKVVYR